MLWRWRITQCMSCRGNCHDNAVAESFFQLLKRERIKKKIYGTREDMIPLCPNWHAMVHRGNESRSLSVDELRQLIEEAKAKRVPVTPL